MASHGVVASAGVDVVPITVIGNARRETSGVALRLRCANTRELEAKVLLNPRADDGIPITC